MSNMITGHVHAGTILLTCAGEPLLGLLIDCPPLDGAFIKIPDKTVVTFVDSSAVIWNDKRSAFSESVDILFEGYIIRIRHSDNFTYPYSVLRTITHMEEPP